MPIIKKYGFKYLIHILILMTLGAIVLLPTASAFVHMNDSGGSFIDDIDTAPRILIIQSYYPNYEWSNAIESGIIETFEQSEYSDAELFIEYMDTKRYPETEYQESLIDIYRHRYKDSEPFDLIIAVDNYAVEFVCSEKGVDIFGNVPVVFLGANSYDPSWKERRPLLTGVMEISTPDSTVELILDLHPDTERILLVTENNSLTSSIIREDAIQKLKPYEDRVAFEIIGNLNETELTQKLSSLPENTVVLSLLYIRDRDDKIYTFAESSTLIAQSSNVPVYVSWKTQLGYGAVGGEVISGHNEGEIAADIAIRVLRGENIEDIPIIDTLHNKYFFDWEQLQRFSISEEELPEGSIILNRNPTFYERHHYQILATAIVLLMQSIVIISLLTNRKKLHVAETQLIVARDKAEKNNELKSSFLANVSHEIRTPMNAILGFSEILRNTELKQEKRERYIELINSSGKNLLGVINDILDISRIEAGKLELFNKDISVNDVISDLHLTYSEMIRSENKDIELIIGSNEPDVQMCADRVRLEQIFSNILENAVKFTKEGSIEFGFKTVNENNIEFYVKDTGIGIPEDMQKFVFGQFQQLHYNHSREYQGTGLGLAISKALTEMMGGKIWLESVAGVGSTFYFVLPLENEKCDGEEQ